MKISETVPFDLELSDLHPEYFDAIICGLGYEERCTFLPKKTIKFNSKKIAIAFDNYHEEDQRIKNNKLLKKIGYDIIISEASDDSKVISLLNALLTDKPRGTCYRLLIDYSSMSTIWYASILKFVSDKIAGLDVELYFSYSYAKFTAPPEEEQPNIHIGPLKGFNRLSIPNKPISLIIGLGYEKNRSVGLAEYLDAELYLFYSLPKEPRFLKSIEIENKYLLTRISPDRIFVYPIDDLEYTENMLYAISRDLLAKTKVILAPCGPKPFTLASLLVSLRLREVEVWRVSPGIAGQPTPRRSNGNNSIYKITFSES